MRSPVTAWLIALSSSAASWPAPPSPTPCSRPRPHQCVAYRLSIVHWIMTALQLKPQRRWLLTP
jgi:hypothetical protein